MDPKSNFESQSFSFSSSKRDAICISEAPLQKLSQPDVTIINFLVHKIPKEENLLVFLINGMAFLLRRPLSLTSRLDTSPTKASLSHEFTPTKNSIQLPNWVPNLQSKFLKFLLSGSLALALSVSFFYIP